jgi:hypothetical protein
VLSLRCNGLCAAGAKILGEGLKGNQGITELDLAGNHMGKEGTGYYDKSDMSGVIILADTIKDLGAMTALNLASNTLRAEGAKILAEAIKVTLCGPAIILVPFSCVSDFSINCCCLLLSAGYGGTIVFESCKKQYWWLHGRF